MTSTASAPQRPWVGLSLMVEDPFRAAVLPLFEDGAVEVLEWSFDIGWGTEPPPEWVQELVGFYSEQGRLLGHGVTFSALSAEWTPRHAWWMEQFRRECDRHAYRQISEHFGFLRAGSFHEGAPLPVPRTDVTRKIGRERLQLLAAAAGVPVGLENLAFAFGPQDVAEQGPFLDELLAPVDGFLLLDLHNIYCQMCNFQVTADELLDSYPLHRVRELHVSGGSWSQSEDSTHPPVRRDTHDEAVPDELYALLTLALRRCPNVQDVIFERLGDTVADSDAEELRRDYARIRETVAAAHGSVTA